MKRVGLVSGLVVGIIGLVACAGNDGAQGASGLTRVVVEAPGANCAAGGQAIEIGVDRDGSGVLDTSEVTGSSYVCNGASAQVTSEILPIASGDPRCQHGGTALRLGGGLAGEVVACNGAPGPQGDAGAPAPTPVLGLFGPSQIVKGAVLTCASTSTSATNVTCNGAKVNGLDLRLAAAEANAVCGAITGKRFYTASGTGVAPLPYLVVSGETFAPMNAGSVAPMQNLSCEK